MPCWDCVEGWEEWTEAFDVVWQKRHRIYLDWISERAALIQTHAMAKVGLYESNLPQDYGNCLFIVDPQLDFHPNDGKRNYEGSLGVPGANDDSLKIAKLIRENIDKLDEIYVTLDTHMTYHIAHPSFWEDKNGKPPKPFTIISKKEVLEGQWTPVVKSEVKWAAQYVTKLEKQGRFQLTIWPPHCRIGTKGHCVNEEIVAALDEWELHRSKCVHYIQKGNNSRTEHYSALKAEVTISTSPETALNKTLINQLKRQKKILICGEALSHCVNYTTRDLVANFPKGQLANICVLKDASSPVKSFEKDAEAFLSDMKAMGVTIIETNHVKNMLSGGRA